MPKMDFMTTTTLSPGRNRRSGFTLVELMIGSTLGAFILAAVLSTFLFMGRSGANVQNYNDMEAQARKALEVFAQDTRQASGVVWSDANTVVLTVGTLSVTYQYNSTARRFARQEVVTASGTVNSTRVLVTGITSFSFSAYNISGNSVPISTAAERTAANGTTKQLQISLEASRSSTTVVAATNTVLSARFVLRNKRVTA
jgi:prepilin-type N-terminal cleavage/methylation domain-containing protein